MNFYPFHIGDYLARTGHLEPLEDLAYRRMIDLYYLREAPLPADADEVARLIRMRGEVDAVRTVLSEFFLLTPEGWSHDRCNEEIARAADKREKARASAAMSLQSRGGRRSANAERTLSERSTNAQRTLSERSAESETPASEGLAPNPNPNPNPKEENPSSTAAPSDEGGAEPAVPPKAPAEDPEFEAVWAAYPKRMGGNPKRDAQRAWRARIKEGVPAEVMQAGVERYAAHLKATGKAGTEYVMQAQRFFGPSRLFAEPWTVPVKPAGGFVHDLSTMDYTRGVDENGNF